MQADKVLRHFFVDEKHPQEKTSRALGRTKSYISNYLATGRVPGFGLMAEIMDAIGYDTLIRNRSTGEEITIDPPDKR